MPYAPPPSSFVQSNLQAKKTGPLSAVWNFLCRNKTPLSAVAVMIGAMGMTGCASMGPAVQGPAAVTTCGHGENSINGRCVEQLPELTRPLEEHGLFKLFWDDPNYQENGTCYGGIDQLNERGVRSLTEYAKKHDWLGNVKPAGEQGRIDDQQRAVVRSILQSSYGRFVSQDAWVKLHRAFNLSLDSAGPRTNGTTDAGTIAIPEVTTNVNGGNWSTIDNLGNAMLQDYRSRPAYFSGEEGELRLLGLLKAYADKAHSFDHGNPYNIYAARRNLMEAFSQIPGSETYGAKDYNGLGFGAAQSIILGIDPNKAPIDFPDAKTNQTTTYLSMSSSQLSGAMKHVDKVREAMGLEPGAADWEKSPVLQSLIGKQQGRVKYGNFNEKKPFSTSGVNFAHLLRAPPGASAELQQQFEEMRTVEPKRGFEFPIDAVTAFDVLVDANPAAGDRLVVVDREGNEVTVQPVIHRDGDGKAKSWSAKFIGADGNEISSGQVTGLIKTASGRVKGDGKAEKTAPMGFWGYCNKNTSQGLIKARYRIPQLDVNSVKIPVGDRVIEIPKADAQKILDSSLDGMVAFWIYSGFRFDQLPATVQLNDGSSVVGTIKDFNFRPTGDVKWNNEDKITFQSNSLEGTYEVNTANGKKNIRARDIRSITGESKTDIRIEHLMGFIARSGGVYGADGSQSRFVSNSRNRVNRFDVVEHRDDERPDWANGDLNGLYGPVERQDGDKMVFVQGLYDNGSSEYPSFKGWMQVDKLGMVINSGFLSGEPDYVFSPGGTLRWQGPHRFNPFVPNDLPAKILVNGVGDFDAETAERVGLSNWESYKAP